MIVAGSAASGGLDENSELRKRLEQIRPQTELRILKRMKVGDAVADVATRVGDEPVDRQLKVITEPLDCYRNAARFGARVLSMTGVVGMFDPAEQEIAGSAIAPFVGLCGGIEIEFINGPVFSETDYVSSGEVVGLTDSPKTEVLWRDMLLSTGDQPIARMLKMDRIMKDSSPLWKTWSWFCVRVVVGCFASAAPAQWTFGAIVRTREPAKRSLAVSVLPAARTGPEAAVSGNSSDAAEILRGALAFCVPWLGSLAWLLTIVMEFRATNAISVLGTIHEGSAATVAMLVIAVLPLTLLALALRGLHRYLQCRRDP